MQTFSIDANDSTLIWTSSTSAGADPVLHVWDVTSGTEVAFNDDFFGPNPMVYIENNTSSARLYQLVLRAKSNGSHGTTTLIRDNVPWLSNIAVGGTHVPVFGGPGYVYETAWGPGTIERTTIFALSSTGNLLGFDFNSGLGQTSRLARNATSTILVSYYPWGGVAGDVQLYVNDTLNDLDNDGLGRLLEEALKTCDRSTSPGCSQVFNHDDSDRDGIDDMAEVFGVDVPNSTQDLYFPRWGANPAAKDMFIEVDYYGADFPGGSPMVAAGAAGLEDWLSAVEMIFDGGTAADIGNLDGSTGVRLHFDIGVDPVNPAYRELYGNWGGGGTPSTNPYYGDAYLAHMRTVRRGYFFYAHARSTGTGQNNNGVSIYWNFGPDGNARTMAHELGHAIALNHHGADEFDGTRLNCRPHYLSIMNYAYQYSVPYFSAVNTEDTFPINAANLTENLTFPADFDGSVLRNLGSWFGTAADTGRSFDWNADGVFTSEAQRWPVNFLNKSCQSLFVDDLAKEMGAAQPPGGLIGAPELVMRGSSRIVMLQAKSDGTIEYFVALNGTLVDGSCPLGDGWNNQCYEWQGPFLVPGVTNATSVSAVWWGNRIVLAYRSTTNQLVLKSSSGLLNTGALGTWSSNLILGNTDVAPELSILNVDATVHGYAALLAVFSNAIGSTHVMFRTTSSNSIINPAVWSAEANVTTSLGEPVNSGLQPSVVPWPHASPPASFSQTATACGVFPSTPDGFLRIYCLDRSSPTLRWTRRGADAQASTMAPTLMFRHDRAPNGSALDPSNWQGTFWLTYLNMDGWTETSISTRFSLTNSPFSTAWSFLPNRGQTSTRWSPPAPGTGVVMLDDPNLGAPKGAWVWFNGETYRLVFHKLADGTVDADLHGGNDFRVMEVRICRRLRGEAFCGSTTQSGWGY